ncbi:MAG: hypothetical protein C3F02_02035 [Parcubacteria group bacterium]|nr:MAG: hypothetical protein C3F02_02035 [Parcubacteria group bacterium]
MLVLLLLPLISWAAVVDRVKGKILLEVEKNGEAWYVIPDGMETGRRIYIKDGDTAYDILRQFGLGITNKNLEKIPIGLAKNVGFYDADDDQDGIPSKTEVAIGTDPNKADSDNDGFDDKTEIMKGYNPLGDGKLNYDNRLVNKLRGKILLQVESRGQAWYLNPADGKRYFMKDGNVAYDIMRFLGLGATTADISSIPNYYVGISDLNYTWGLNFGKIVNLTSVTNTLPAGVSVIKEDLNAYDKELLISFTDYQIAQTKSDCTINGYYCAKLTEGKWVSNGVGSIQLLLENDNVYRRLGSVTSRLILVKKINNNLKLILTFHDEKMDNGNEVTAFNVATIGGADEMSGILTGQEIKNYFDGFLKELGLDIAPLADLKTARTHYYPTYTVGNTSIPIK